MPRGRPIAPVIVTDVERLQLDSMAHRARSAPQLARRARIVLACAGHANREVARRTRVTPATVGKWRARFHRDRVAG